MPPIPSNTVLELHPIPAKAIQRAPDREVHLPAAQPLHQLKILQMPRTTGVRNGDAAPLRQLLDELLVDALLQPLIVRSVDEELGTVGLKALYGLYEVLG